MGTYNFPYLYPTVVYVKTITKAATIWNIKRANRFSVIAINLLLCAIYYFRLMLFNYVPFKHFYNIFRMGSIMYENYRISIMFMEDFRLQFMSSEISSGSEESNPICCWFIIHQNVSTSFLPSYICYDLLSMHNIPCHYFIQTNQSPRTLKWYIAAD